MKIIVNAIPLNNISTGIGRYLKCLYDEIQGQRPDLTIRYFDGRRLCKDIPKSPEKYSLWAFAVSAAWKLPPLLTYRARNFVYQQHARSFLKLSQGFDLYHEAGYFPFKTAAHVKTVFTLHDLSLKAVPHFHPKERVLFFQKYFRQSLSNVHAIITPSHFTRDEFKKYFPDIALPVFPIHLGFEKQFFFKDTAPAINSLKLRMQLPSEYMLFVGTSDPRKNIRTIICAMRFLPESIKLVVAGWKGWEGFLDKNQTPNVLKNRIICADYVADRDLAALYSGARVLVYPSYYEGFGLPVLEAMACGCPVICSDRGALPEVAGDAGIICSPDDPERLAASIHKVFDSDALYFDMQRRGLQQVQKFSWENTAKETLSVFGSCFAAA